MEPKKTIGLFSCIVLIGLGFVMQGNIGIYFNVAALCIVIGGTLGATLISFKTERLAILYRILKGSCTTQMREPDEIVEILIDLSVKSKLKGLLSLQEDEKEISILFLRRALGFLVDGYPAKEIREILSTEMSFFKIRREESERVLRTMAEICPAFGLVGSVVGLTGMLTGIGDISVIIKTIPIALTSTLYGVICANFFLLPFATNISERTNHELLLQKIIMEGVIAIEKELHPRLLEFKLKSFLTPSSRNVKLVSLERIREKFNIAPNPKLPPRIAKSTSRLASPQKAGYSL